MVRVLIYNFTFHFWRDTVINSYNWENILGQNNMINSFQYCTDFPFWNDLSLYWHSPLLLSKKVCHPWWASTTKKVFLMLPRYIVFLSLDRSLWPWPFHFLNSIKICQSYDSFLWRSKEIHTNILFVCLFCVGKIDVLGQGPFG